MQLLHGLFILEHLKLHLICLVLKSIKKNQSVITVAVLLLLLYFHLIEKCSSDVMQSGTAVSINRSLYSCIGGSFRTEDISFAINEFSGFSVMRMEERGRTHPRCLIWWGHRGRWDISISCYLATACWSVKAVCIASWSLVYCSYTKTTPRITPSFSESLQKKKDETKTKTSPPLQSCHRSVHYISQPIHSSREPCLHSSLYKENCRYCLVLYLPAKTQLALSIRATSIYCLSAQTNYPQYRGGGKIQEKKP